jgi:predicted DNA binding CopG/RHH family protein
MKKEYDFSKMRRKRNPYAKMLKKQITIRIGSEAIEYFKLLAKETGLTYQNLINLYLADCAAKHKKLNFNWK